jgi:hypothetical protein
MCMISLPVDTVSKTKIFVGLNADKTRQLTVYSNFVANKSKLNAMVIPVPYPNLVNFHDFSGNVKFFKDVDKSFVLEQTILTTKGSRGFSYDCSLNSTLKVMDVGSYKVSLVPQFSDMCHLNEDYFILSEEIKFILGHMYSESYWGYIVFILADESKEYHPFGFSHQVIHNTVYVPTRHFHCHEEQNPYNYKESYRSYFGEIFDPNLEINLKKQQDNMEDWDHDIYLYNCNSCPDLETMKSKTLQYRFTGDFHFDKNKIDFDLQECDQFSKYRIKGRQTNMDIMIPLPHRQEEKDVTCTVI